jgi:chaperonin GroES
LQSLNKFVRKLTPLFDRVLVERTKQGPKTSIGGIVLPETTKEKANEGTVVAIGKGKRTSDGKFIPLSVKVGDVVLLSDFGGSDVKMNGKDMILIREEDILGVVEDTDQPIKSGGASADIPNVKDLPK